MASRPRQPACQMGPAAQPWRGGPGLDLTVMPDCPEDRQDTGFGAAPAINSISAVTLATHEMARAVRFYRCLGFSLRHGGGRIVLYVSDVDAIYEIALANGLDPDSTPRDAEGGERYFHLSDPDGHQLSFAKPLASPS